MSKDLRTALIAAVAGIFGGLIVVINYFVGAHQSGIKMI